jgi:aryl-alcohol dehydrogenase-like predicted oxidoreductase
LAKNKNLENEIFHKAIDKFTNSEQQKLSLSQKAILLINSVPQVSSTLVGMKSIEYVEDVQKSIKNEFINNYMNFWHSNGHLIQ